MTLVGIVGVGHGVGGAGIGGYPLLGPGGALREIPIVPEKRVEIAIVPLGRGRRPSAFQATADRIATGAAAVAVLPAQAHFLDRGRFRFASHVLVGIRRAMGLAESVAACDERDGLFVIHRHSAEGFANVFGGSQSARIAVGTLGVDVDQTHLHGAQRIVEIAVARVALVAQPLGFRPPIDVLFRFPYVFATT